MFPSVPLLNKFKKNFFLYPLILLLTIIGSYALISAYFFPVGLSQLPAIIVLTASFIIFADFILPILKYRTFNNLKNNIINDRTNTRANNNSNILLQSKNQYFNIIIFAIFLLFLTYAVASVIANMNVQSNSIYYTFKKDKGTYALIRTYGDENISEKVKSNILDPGSIYIFKSDSLILEKESLKLPTIKSQNPL